MDTPSSFFFFHYVLRPPNWGLWRVLCYESGAPPLDHFVEVTKNVDRCSAEFAYMFSYVLFLCFL